MEKNELKELIAWHLADERDIDLIMEAIEKYASQQDDKWISVEERLPDCKPENSLIECSEPVIIYDKNLGANKAWLKRFLRDDGLLKEFKKGDIIFESVEVKFYNVTHWQPLPKAPNQSKKDN